MTIDQSYREKIQSYNDKIRARNLEQIREFIKNKENENDWTHTIKLRYMLWRDQRALQNNTP